MPHTRSTQIQVKVSHVEKERYQEAAKRYQLPLAAFARYAMEYVARNNVSLQIDPIDVGDENEDPEEEERRVIYH